MKEIKLTQIAIKVSTDGYNMISVSDYLKIPAENRLQLIIDGKVRFLDEDGSYINAMEALKLLRPQVA